MLNKEIYSAGSQQFDEKYTDIIRRMNDEEYSEFMEDMAWRAVYNDNYMIDTDELGYFFVVEYYGIEEANEYLEFRAAA